MLWQSCCDGAAVALLLLWWEGNVGPRDRRGGWGTSAAIPRPSSGLERSPSRTATGQRKSAAIHSLNLKTCPGQELCPQPRSCSGGLKAGKVAEDTTVPFPVAFCPKRSIFEAGVPPKGQQSMEGVLQTSSAPRANPWLKNTRTLAKPLCRDEPVPR